MSRWTQTFESHPFQQSWSEIVDLMSEFDDAMPIGSTDVLEIARLSKTIAFVDEALKSLDSELMPLNVSTNIHGPINNTLQYIRNYLSDKNIAHIHNANNQIDTILVHISPYVIVQGKAARTLKAALNRYSESINKSLENFNAKAPQLIGDIESLKQQAETMVDEIFEFKNDIEEFWNKTFSENGNEDCYQLQIESFLDDINKKRERIISFEEKLYSGSEEDSSIVYQIENAKQSIEEDKTDIEDLLENISQKTDELKQFYRHIFGDSEAEEPVKGLKQELAERIEALDEFKNQQERKYNALVSEIDSLLPGATSAGLASAYHDLKKSFDRPIKVYSVLFYVVIVLLFISAFYTLPKGENITLSSIMNHFLIAIPLIGPLLWLNIFASKRRSELMRLQQEYAHKEALAKSYEGFKKQIEDIGSEDKELMIKLLDSAIKTIAFNPSTTLDKKHSSNLPIQEITESVISKLTPGTKK